MFSCRTTSSFQLSTLLISHFSSFLTQQQHSIKLTTFAFLNIFSALSHYSLLVLFICHWLLLLSHFGWFFHIYLIFKHCPAPGLNLWMSLYIYKFMWFHGFKFHLYTTDVHSYSSTWLLTWGPFCLLKISNMFNTNLNSMYSKQNSCFSLQI